MNQWRKVAFEEIFDISSSKRVLQEDWKSSGVPFYRAREIVKLAREGVVDNDLFISEELYKTYESKYGVPKTGDLMVSAVGTLGACYVVQPSDRFYYKDASVLRFSPKEELCSRFIQHAFRTPEINDQIQASSGSTVGTYTIQRANKTQIALPKLPDQRRITAILDQADALRAKRREALAQLDSLTQSIFIEMFGDPVTNPKGWTMRPFSEVCETRLGKMLDARQQTGQDKRRYLRNANVQWFRIDLYDLLEMDFDSDARETFNLKKGDLLICEGGEPGRAAVWQGQLDDVYFQKALHRGRPKAGIANPEYLVWLLWFLAHNGGLGDHVTAATIAHLTGEKLKAMPIPVPPLGMQQVFATRLQSVEVLKATHIAALLEMDRLFASLQRRAFQGEL